MSEPGPQSDSDEAKSAFVAARKICRRHAPELVFFAQLLPGHKRDGLCAVISFAAMLQEAVEHAAVHPMTGANALRSHPAVVGMTHGCCSSGSQSIDTLLAMFHDRLAEIYAARLELPSPASRSEAQHALQAFALTVKRFEVPAKYFQSFADSLRTEATVVRQVSTTTLRSYLDMSGGALSQAVACILGVTSPDALDHAASLGRAIRLIRLLQTINEDWKRGRLNLPQTEIAKHRYSERDLASGVCNGALRAVIARQIAQGRRWLADASGAFVMLAGDRERLAAAWLVAACARELDRLEAMPEESLLNPPRRHFSVAGAIQLLPRAWRDLRTANRLRAAHRPLAR